MCCFCSSQRLLRTPLSTVEALAAQGQNISLNITSRVLTSTTKAVLQVSMTRTVCVLATRPRQRHWPSSSALCQPGSAREEDSHPVCERTRSWICVNRICMYLDVGAARLIEMGTYGVGHYSTRAVGLQQRDQLTRRLLGSTHRVGWVWEWPPHCTTDRTCPASARLYGGWT